MIGDEIIGKDEDCPCGSGRCFERCCDLYLTKKENPPTALDLMRSRYSAFVVENIDYLLETHDPETRSEVNRDDLADWAENSVWGGLHILGTEAGESNDQEGKVEFVAHYEQNSKAQSHHELSEFVKKDGKWFFHQGYMVDKTFKREQPKVGRNDPCHCGSQKKFKKCHGA